jgi:L-rhamnose mutarotase
VERIGFRLQVKPELMDEYVERHQNVWDDMLAALSATGWTNYSLFLDRTDGTLFGYVETPSLEAARSGMAATEVNARWQADMQKYFVELEGKNPDEGFHLLEQVFFLQ